MSRFNFTLAITLELTTLALLWLSKLTSGSLELAAQVLSVVTFSALVTFLTIVYVNHRMKGRHNR